MPSRLDRSKLKTAALFAISAPVLLACQESDTDGAALLGHAQKAMQNLDSDKTSERSALADTLEQFLNRQAKDAASRVLLSQVLQDLSIVQNDAKPVAERLSRLDTIDATLARIMAQYPTTDIGLQLASRQAFGVLDPTALPQTRATLETLQQIEVCGDAPTVGCLKVILSEFPPGYMRSDDQVLNKAYQIAFDANIPLDDIDFSSRQEIESAVLFAAILAIADGEIERVGALLANKAVQDGLDRGSERAAILYAISPHLDFVLSGNDGSLLKSLIQQMAQAEHDDTQDPLAGFLAAALSGTTGIDALGAAYDSLPSGVDVSLPQWVWINSVFMDPDSDEYERVMVDGLSNVDASNLTDAQMTQIALATLERGRDFIKGEVLWHAAKFGIADAVLPTAEELGGPFNNRGYYAAAEGARQLGYQGDHETFDRILDVMSFGSEQEAGIAMVEKNYAFGQALAGDIEPLRAIDGIDSTIVRLASILKGLPPTTANEAFNYDADTRLGSAIGEEGLERASLLAWVDTDPASLAQVADGNIDMLLAGYEQARLSGRANSADLWRVLRALPTSAASYALSRIDEPGPIPKVVDLHDTDPALLLGLMNNRSVIEQSLRDARAASE